MRGRMAAGLRGRTAAALLAACFVGSCSAQYLEGTFNRAIGYEADGRTETGGEVVPGTPPEGSVFTMQCTNPLNPSTPSTCQYPWPTGISPSWCPVGFHCFAVVTPAEQAAGAARFTHSDALQSAINNRNIIVRVDTSQGLQSAVGIGPLRLTIYNIRVVNFVDADDLEVCFRAGDLGERCVGYVLGREPDWMMVRTEGTTTFAPALTTRGFAYQSTLLFVRAHDFNRRDTLQIDLIADHNGTTASPTSNLIFVDARSDLNLQAAAFRWLGPATCVDPDATAGYCPSGVWERVGALKPKFFALTYNATFGAMDDTADEILEAKARAVAAVVTDSTAPSWLDDITSNRAGVPVGSPLAGQYVGFVDPEAMRTAQDGSVLTRARAFVNCNVRVSLYSLAGPEPEALADVALVSERPHGMAIEHSPERLTLPAIGVNKGNAGLVDAATQVGQMTTRTDVQWTPQRGQEGGELTLCFEASMGVPPSSNRRCFLVAVARCRYCAVQGDTLASIARAFHTTWLQLWSANDARSLQVNPGALLVLGPTYTTKPLDSLDSLATRLHTDVQKLLFLNPDIKDASVIPVGHEICFIPDICPA